MVHRALVLRLVVIIAVLAWALKPAISETSAAPSHADGLRGSRPVLAFYYTWYHRSTWCTCTMSDLPTQRYESGDVSTIDRQIDQAWDAGLTGFIASWPGPGNTQDANLGTLLARLAAYEARTGHHLVTSLYVESDADAIKKDPSGAMRYAIQHYASNPHFFKWHGKPGIFIWHPVGNGRTLSTWAALRRQVDPGHRLLWSAEGTDLSLLGVFDGLHLFSAGDWGVLNGTMRSVDGSFRSRIDAYKRAHRATKIWAAGVEPGYDDRRVPGRPHPHRVPRNNGGTYRTSWHAAMASRPEWITVSTFNEWFEGAMIEPSVHFGSRYLDLTKQLAHQWRHGR